MEDEEDDEDEMLLDMPSQTAPPAPEPVAGQEGPANDEDEWDTESAFSDASTDILIEDEDDVVPPSFTLPTFVYPKPDEGDDPLEPPPQPQEERAINVHGSDSKL